MLIELAQNASDAAARAGTAGRLRIRLVDGVLTAANTGEPLDKAGVDALTSLRASAKRGTDAVGRFGVGFAAVLAVSDEPEVRSIGGGVAFSRRRTTEAVAAGGGAAAEELARRDGQVPVLRLVWPAPETPPEGYATEVLLPLRDREAEEAVRRSFAELDASVLLSLPRLTEIDLNGRLLQRRDLGSAGATTATVILTDDGVSTRWRLATATGEVPVELLAGQRVEDRGRTTWRASAAVPVNPAGEPRPLPTPQPLHAPTVTDESTGIGMRLVATFELTPDRRRIVESPLTAHLARRLGELAAEVVIDCAGTPAALAPLPSTGLPASTVDGQVRQALLAALRRTAWLPERRHAPAEDQLPVSTGAELTPDRAIAVDDMLVDPLSEVVDGVLPASWWTTGTAPVLRELGVRRWSLAEVVDALAGVDREPDWWRWTYDGIAAILANDPTADPDAPAALRVPLADGRTVTGARDTLLPTDAVPVASVASAVAGLGLRIVHPDAAHPLLERYGARPATAETVLADPRVRAAVEDSVDAAADYRGCELPRWASPVNGGASVGGSASANGETSHEDDRPLTGTPEALLDAVLTLISSSGAFGSPVWSGGHPVGTGPGIGGPGIGGSGIGGSGIGGPGIGGDESAGMTDWGWLADLAVPDVDGRWRAAGELVIPGGAFASVLAVDAPFGRVATDVVAAYGAPVLVAVGVLDAFAVVDEAAVDLIDLADDTLGFGLDGLEDWAAEILDVRADDADTDAPPRVARFRAVRDLEYVADDSWPAALRLLAAEPARSVLLADCTLADTGEVVPSYTRWWLSNRPILDGRRPGDLRLARAAELAGLYDAADAADPDGADGGDSSLDERALAALGVRTGLADVLTDPAAAIDLLARLGDEDRAVRAAILPQLYARIAEALAGFEVDPPAYLRVEPALVVPAEDAVVVDVPWRLDRLGGLRPILGGADPESVAELLDIPLLSELD